MSSCQIGQYLNLFGCDTCPETAEGCDVHKPLYMKIYYACLNCTEFSTPVPTLSDIASSNDTETHWIWVAVGVAFIILGLLIICLVKWKRLKQCLRWRCHSETAIERSDSTMINVDPQANEEHLALWQRTGNHDRPPDEELRETEL